jgi:hypothetical protein
MIDDPASGMSRIPTIARVNLALRGRRPLQDSGFGICDIAVSRGPESPAYAAKRLRRGLAVARPDSQRAEAGEPEYDPARNGNGRRDMADMRGHTGKFPLASAAAVVIVH